MTSARFILPSCLFVGLVACSSSGAAPIGPDTYMLSVTGPPNWLSGGALTGDLFRQADAFCRGQGKELMPARAVAHDADFFFLAQAEIEFRCLPRGECRGAVCGRARW
jgi:hypothetical protein